MDKRFVIPGLLKYDTERIELIGADADAFTYNGTRVATQEDLDNQVNETLHLIRNTAFPITLLNQNLTFATLSPASVDGITFVAPSTVHVTKAGNYTFQLSNSLDLVTGASIHTRMLVDAVPTDGANWCGVRVGAIVEITQQNEFFWSQTTDAPHDITFSIAGDSFPVAGVAPSCVTDLVIVHTRLQ